MKFRFIKSQGSRFKKTADGLRCRISFSKKEESDGLRRKNAFWGIERGFLGNFTLVLTQILQKSSTFKNAK